MRFRFVELLSVISVAGIFLAALFQPTEFNATVIFSMTFLITLFAVAMAIGRRGAARSFWLAFALAAISYLIFSNASASTPRTWGPEFTTRSLHLMFEKVHETTPVSPGGGGMFNVESGKPGDEKTGDEPEPLDPLGHSTSSIPTAEQLRLCQFGGGMGGNGFRPTGNLYSHTSFMRIGQCVWALVLAWCMGHLTQFIYLRSNEEN